MPDRASIIARNLTDVRHRMANAAIRSGRHADDARLVAVTKYVEVDEIRGVLAAGVRDVGESRPQQLWQRAETLAETPARWHLIGHWQRNKIRRALPHVTLLHAGDASKHGFAPAELEPLLPQLAALAGIRVRGLMAMSGLASDDDRKRGEFAAVRALRDRLAGVSPAGLEWHELSLGMSDDFELAIEEGATCVRVGSALFAGLES